MKTKIIKNSVSNTLGYIITIGVAFFLTPFIVQKLGKDVYGVWSIMVSLTGYFGLLDFGLRTAVVKYASEHHAAQNYAEINRINSTTRTLYTIIGMVSWAAIVGISFSFPQIFNIGGISRINFTLVMFIIGADVFFTFYFMIYQGNIAGLQRYDVIFLNSSIALITRAGLSWFFLNRGYGLGTLVVIGMFSNLLGFCLNYLSCKSICGELKFKIGRVDRSQLNKVWNYSLKSFIINVSDRIIYYSDSIIIGIFLNPKSVTFYVIASSLIAYLRSLVLAISGGFIPAVSEANKKGDTGQIHKVIIDGTKLIMFVLVPIFCGFIIVGNDFIRLWMGPGFEETYQVLLILSVGQFLVLSQYGVAMALYGTSQHGLIARINILVALVNIVLAVVFVRIWGLVGVAVGSGIAMCILQLFLIPMLRLVNMSFTTFFEKAQLPFLMVGVVYSGFLILCREAFYPSTWVKFAEIILLSALFYLPLCYYVALGKVQRGRMVVLITDWRKRLSIP